MSLVTVGYTTEHEERLFRRFPLPFFTLDDIKILCNIENSRNRIEFKGRKYSDRKKKDKEIALRSAETRRKNNRPRMIEVLPRRKKETVVEEKKEEKPPELPFEFELDEHYPYIKRKNDNRYLIFCPFCNSKYDLNGKVNCPICGRGVPEKETALRAT